MLVFFFQAEDGIRDRTVTGVQTCALPIWLRDEADLRLVRGRDGISDGDERMVPPPWHAGGMEGFLVRSEGSPLLLHREGQHRVSHNLLAGNPDGLRWQARLAVRCAGYAIPKHFGGANERRSRPRRVAI